jgi:hypothetical protein
VRLRSTRFVSLCVLFLFLAHSALADDQTFEVSPGEQVSFTVPRNGPKIVIDYSVVKGQVTQPMFNYSDTSNCDNKWPTVTDPGPHYYSINLQNDATGSEIGTDSGTTGPVYNLYDCGCPYWNPPPCPYNDDDDATEYLARRKVFDISDWTKDADVPMTIRANRIFIHVTVIGAKPDQGQFETEEADFAPQISDLGITPPPSLRSPVTNTDDPVPNQTMVVPLGLAFNWGYVKRGTGKKVPARFELLAHHFDPEIPNDAAKYPGRPTVLYYDRVLIAFGPAEDSVDKKHFLGIHLGTQFFKATPDDTNLKPMIIKVIVKPPESMGKVANDLDAAFTNTAHRRGIPPHYLKGQGEQESDKRKVAGKWVWVREGYRYEPYSSDLAECSRGNKLRSKAPYQRYRMATQPGDGDLAEGVSLSRPADTEFRNTLKYKRNGTTAYLDETVTDVTCREIVDGSNGGPGVKGQRWDVQNAGTYNSVENELAATGNDRISFNAQTPMAASYGLLQALWTSIIRYTRWNDALGPGVAVLNPSLLSDTDDNLAAGDGSLNVSSIQLTRNFVLASSGGVSSCTTPTFDPNNFATVAEFQNAYRNSLNLYNCYWKDSDTGIRYGQSVINKTKNYIPKRSDTGFQ